MAEKFAAAARSISLCAGLLRRSSRYSIRCDRTSATCLAVARLCTVSIVNLGSMGLPATFYDHPCRQRHIRCRFAGSGSKSCCPSQNCTAQMETVSGRFTLMHCRNSLECDLFDTLCKLLWPGSGASRAVGRHPFYLLVYGSHSQGFARIDAELTL